MRTGWFWKIPCCWCDWWEFFNYVWYVCYTPITMESATMHLGYVEMTFILEVLPDLITLESLWFNNRMYISGHFSACDWYRCYKTLSFFTKINSTVSWPHHTPPPHHQLYTPGPLQYIFQFQRFSYTNFLRVKQVKVDFEVRIWQKSYPKMSKNAVLDQHSIHSRAMGMAKCSMGRGK